MMYQGAASQWGTGKLHLGRWDNRLSRWVPNCQKLNPIKGGHDVYDGQQVETNDPPTCKRCLSQVEEESWAYVVEQLGYLLSDIDNSYYSDSDWFAKRVLRQYLTLHPEVKVDTTPDWSKERKLAAVIAEDYRVNRHRYGLYA